MAALDAAGLAYEVIPGISAAQGAAARLRVPLTERTVARRLQFVTGHARNGQLPDDLDVSALADGRTTTAVYMPQRTLPALVARALQAGAPSSLPAVAVFDATRPSQQTVAAPLAELASAVGAAGASGPCVLLLGASVRGAQATVGVPAALARVKSVVGSA
jgi:uroporphyrin-III C-methyltransferase/precorrin-2 dehydrogenase/sirohydrochlorin ferrochelatase